MPGIEMVEDGGPEHDVHGGIGNRHLMAGGQNEFSVPGQGMGLQPFSGYLEEMRRDIECDEARPACPQRNRTLSAAAPKIENRSAPEVSQQEKGILKGKLSVFSRMEVARNGVVV